ncbi:uncharacterized protein K02A2.6-like [Monomorium pharaonis]|uniref:uncharacterized protein K02A2.6-like n=1 Tax=Monomorium pharaonis TaxID=307658 RepID=UPI00174694A8|nr:uncharacterized protein K02A2.6-like [Monomorium pharaonis]
MALIGSIEPFNSKESDITTYLERIEQLFVCNDINEAKKVSVFLTLIGGDAYGVLKDLLAPSLPTKQETEEDVKAYAVRLKNLAKYCEFATFLEEALRDKFVCGIRSEGVKRKLLTEDNLTFNRAYELAVGIELAESQVSQKVHPVKVVESRAKIKGKKQRATKPSHSQLASRVKCKRCLRVHFEGNKCPAINWTCYSCQQTGHTAKSPLCKNRVHSLQSEESEIGVSSAVEDEESLELGLIQESTEGELYHVHSVTKSRENESLKVALHIENKLMTMEVDSGACKSVIHVNDYNKWLSHLALRSVSFKLRVVTGEKVEIVGQVLVRVRYTTETFKLPLIVLNGKTKFIPLLGRNWLNVLNPKWREVINMPLIIKSVSQCKVESSQVDHFGEAANSRKRLVLSIRSQFGAVFKEESNTSIKNFKVDVKLKKKANPIFHRAYQMPFALKPKVEEELSRMVEEGILSKVTHSRWASPIVVIPKKNGKDVRICVDFKKTLNTVIDTEHCVLPLPEDIYANLSGSRCFTVIDLKGAYQQLAIGDSSKELFTINTHLGLFKYNRLTFGVRSAPGIFQSIMESILAGLKNTQCYLDDILVHGATVEQCYRRVEFLGHIVDANGIHPTGEKIECIQKAPAPTNVTQLKSYLGLLSYYRKFIPMLSAKLKPLYELCNTGSEFRWNDECEKTFQSSKKLLTSDEVLTHFDPTLPIVVTCDSSGYGVSAVLSHIIEGKDKAVLFASSTLSPAKQKYSNLERESLALIFSLKKFHKYIYGRRFILLTDHQPLQFIFGKNKGIPVTAAARITRWALTLSAYDYEIRYKKGKLIANADGLSRLPMSASTEIPGYLNSFSLLNTVPLHAGDVARATQKDRVLTKVIEFTLSGWARDVEDEALKPYFTKRHELSVENNCLLLGNKVIIPESLRTEVLNLFHEQHVGIVRSKMLLRAYCWWPGINDDVEKFISSCEVCQQTQNFSNSSTLLSWPTAPNVFYRVNIDFFHKYNHTFLMVSDSKSKWIEVKLMDHGSTASETILKLKEVFAVYGLPVELVSDNGPPFNSSEFSAFCQANGIKPVKSPPYHPQSNGSAERSIQTVKKGLERALFTEKGRDIGKNVLLTRLINFLFTYRNIPSTVTGKSPAENIFKMRPGTRFDLIKPFSKEITMGHKGDAKEIRLYTLNEPVYVKNIPLKMWEKGKIIKVLSHSTYLVQIADKIRFVHANDIRVNPYMAGGADGETQPSITEQPMAVDYNKGNVSAKDEQGEEEVPACKKEIVEEQASSQRSISKSNNYPSLESSTSKTYSTRSGRIVKPPARLTL